jgi:hypothetical protein
MCTRHFDLSIIYHNLAFFNPFRDAQSLCIVSLALAQDISSKFEGPFLKMAKSLERRAVFIAQATSAFVLS